MGFFDLPGSWVFVVFSDGFSLNVANTDTLSKDEAIWYKKEWSNSRYASEHGNIVCVQLRSGDCITVVKEFTV